MELEEIFIAAESTNPTMSRVFRRKKKSVNNFEEEKNCDSATEKNPFFQSTFVKWERVLGKIPHRADYSYTEYRKRLAGGADKDINGANHSAQPMDADKRTSNDSTTRLGMPHRRDSQASPHHHSRAISEKKVDEIIDCAIQNLQEAGKALATLGENHEHEIKLLVMDILAKFQKWIDVVQKRMDGAKNDVNSIRRLLAAQTIVLTAKDQELAALRTKLAECEANKANSAPSQGELGAADSNPSRVVIASNATSLSTVNKTAHEKSLADNQLKSMEYNIVSNVEAASNVTASIPSNQSPVQAEIPFQHLPSEIIVQPIASASHHALEKNNEPLSSRPVISVLAPPGESNHSQNVQDTIGDNNTSRNVLISLATIADHSQTHLPSSAVMMPSTSPVQTSGNKLLDYVSIPGQTDSSPPLSEPFLRDSATSIQQKLTPSLTVQQKLPLNPSVEQNTVLSPGIQQNPPPSPSIQQNPTPSSNVQQNSTPSPTNEQPVMSSGAKTGTCVASPVAPPRTPQLAPDHDKEQNRRMIELEAELIELRSENERMKTDHAGYENAIQRALLQGVSSLNAEALKVLRNPPFICYKPCEPCNPLQPFSSNDTTENAPCVSQGAKNHTAQRNGKNSLSKVGVICKGHENCAHSSSRKQATSVCYAPAKRSSHNSMLFLFPQKRIDCACTAAVQKYCVSTNYGRVARTFPRDRTYCTSRVTAGRGGLIRQYSRAVNRCEPQ